MILTPCLSKKTKKIMNSNISRDHIALEAMKIVLDKSLVRAINPIDRIKEFFCKGETKTRLICIPQNEIAIFAYKLADAMIEERNKNNNNNE